VCFSLWYLYYHPADSHHQHRPTADASHTRKQNEKLRNIIRVLKSRSVSCAEHVTCIGANINVYKMLVAKYRLDGGRKISKRA
jgi:hypothetical protein